MLGKVPYIKGYFRGGAEEEDLRIGEVLDKTNKYGKGV